MLLDQLDLILNLRIINNNRNSILIQTYLFLLYSLLLKVLIKIVSLINSSSIALVFIDKDSLIKKHNIIVKRLLVLKPFRLTNRLLSSFITYYFIVKIIIGHYIKSMLFYIIKLSPLILVIFEMPQLKKYNLKIDFPILELKFNSNYYTYNYLPQYIPDCNQVVLYRYIVRLTLKYHQLTVKKVPNTSELIYIINRAKILKN